ncbi:MAG: hypothetical protein EA397_03725 [Deltaproteobacteria bacterium]|nr:MAG: hypothetical protein EA397_03725 [Deltaproteobacteria bacterium]
MPQAMIVMALSIAVATAGCRAHPKRVHWGSECTLTIQESSEEVSVGVVEEGELSACVDAAPEGMVYVYGRNPTCPHGWLWFSGEHTAETLRAKIDTRLAASTLPCLQGVVDR